MNQVISVFAQGDLVFEREGALPAEQLAEVLADYLPAHLLEALKAGVELVVSLSVGESAAKKLRGGQ